MNSIAKPEIHNMEVHVAKIRSSGTLARSNHLNSLFEFLYVCYTNNRIPKELEIAIEGMGREQSFDVTQDAVVRVYIHKLRRKLDEFYAQEGKNLPSRIIIPKGEYRLALESRDAIAIETLPLAPPKKIGLAIIIVLVISLATNLLLLVQNPLTAFFSEEHAIRQESLWQPLFADAKPIVIVVGDYYIFAETDDTNTVKRLVRDFDINSHMELANFLQLYPELAEQKFDVGLSYLPTSTAYALNKVSPIINSDKKTARIIPSSELTAEILRNSHIIYIGHLSGLGLLSDAIFEVSGFHVGSGGYDELIDKQSGERFVSSNGLRGEHSTNVSHLAYLSSFTGPTHNRIITIAGFRDAGLKELADVVNSPADLENLTAQHAGSSFEAIYQVAGFGQATTPAKLLKSRSIKNVVTQTD